MRTLAKNVVRGGNEVRWNGTESHGESCASGIYFVRMTFPDGRPNAPAALGRQFNLWLLFTRPILAPGVKEDSAR